MRSLQSFFYILPILLILLSVYLGFRLRKWSHWTGPKLKVMIAALAARLVTIFLGMTVFRMKSAEMRDWTFTLQVVFLVMGSFVTLLLYTILLDLVFLPLWFKNFLKRKKATKKIDFDRRKFMTLGATTAGSVAVGSWQAQGPPTVHHVPINIKNLPKEFWGFKIAQISDLRVGAMIGLDYVKKVVETANATNADVIALTGDIADGPLSAIKKDVMALKDLKAKSGIFYITGNHEYYWGIEDWLPVFQELGFRILMNEHVVLERDQAKLVLAGVNDFDSGKRHNTHVSDPMKAIAGAPENAPKILLAHQPKSYAAASAADFDLQISGHTHGGQFFPWSLIVAMAQPYYVGLNKHENLWIYTSTGTGFWGPPLRFMVAKEIALIELIPEQNESL